MLETVLMYVCVCHGVSDRDIHRAVSDGAKSLDCLSKELKVATCCGRCADCAKQVLKEAASEQAYSVMQFQPAMA